MIRAPVAIPNLTTSITGGSIILAATLTANRTWTFPDRSDTFAGITAAQTFTAAQTINTSAGSSTRTPTATTQLSLIGTTAPGIDMESYAGTATISAYAADGTIASPSLPTINRGQGYRVLGWTSSGTWLVAASLDLLTTETWVAPAGVVSASGAGLRFRGTTTGATGIQTWGVWQGGASEPSNKGALCIGTSLTTGNGLLQIVSGTTKASGIALGTDVFVFRNGTTAITIDAASGITTTGGITLADAKDLAFGTSTGTKIGTATSQKIGFWNKTPVVQPSSTGESAGFTAGAGTTVTHLSTFTGNSGSTAYTISDIVKHLKAIGVLLV
jgi:hypothetical protein